jgi:hypothetical protein
LTDQEKQTLWPQKEQAEISALRIYDLDGDFPILRRDFRSYAGWLLTNRQFLDEHDRLWSDHRDVIARWGTGQDLMPQTQLIDFGESPKPENDCKWLGFVASRDAFCLRWRLGGLPGPYLPEPLGPQMDGTIDANFLQTFRDAGSFFFLPDTIPLPSRDELRDSIEDSRARQRNSGHLAEWFKYIRPNNSARNQLDRFSRIFELQHYWRILNERHGDALTNSIGKLEHAFANWFDISRESIRGDLIRIRQRLGSNWMQRKFPTTRA